MPQFPVRKTKFRMDGLQIASVEDKTQSTGATLFYFPKGALAQADIRGGSAATSETSLLEPGSMSAWIDGVVFAGGSTMGLAAGDGVRKFIYQNRGSERTHFDLIPSVPTAVVYDFGGRTLPSQNAFVYPDEKMGQALMENLSPDTFLSGRAGAGICTTANKISKRIWGGQGLAYVDIGFGNVVSAVINNPFGNVNAMGIKSLDGKKSLGPQPGTNTTLSITITDVSLDRNQLKRMAVMVHTSMARSIFPFQSFTDGDVHFAVSLGRKALNPKTELQQITTLSVTAADLMAQAILLAVQTANKRQVRKKNEK